MLPRIAGILLAIDSGSLGGGQTQLLALARHLPRDRFRVAVASSADGPLVAAVRAMGLVHHAIPFGKPWSVRPLGPLRALLRGGAFDLIHTHGGIAGLWGRWAAADCAVRAVHTFHGIHYLHFSNPIMRWAYGAVDRWLEHLTQGAICVSQADLVAGQRAGVVPSGRGWVVRNAIDPWRVETTLTRQAARELLGVGASGRLVGSIGRLHPQKAPHDLVAMAAELARDPGGVTVLLVGDGPSESAVRRQIESMGLGAVVKLLPGRLDVGTVYRALDVFVLSSLWEGLPLSPLEAHVVGTPVVATAVDGTTEVISDGQTGLLVPPSSPIALAAAVRRVLADGALATRLVAAGRERVARDFTLERMVRETSDIYTEVLNRRW